MNFDLSKTTGRVTYNLLIGLVNPRPIALVTSMDLNGKLNAAPFSAFNYVGTDPAIVAIGVGNRPGPGVVGKDTAQNIRNTKEFVVNVVSEEIANNMNVCAIDFPPGRSELEEAGFSTEPSTHISVPRIAQSPASLECREYATIEVGNSRVILGLVLAINVRDDLIDPAGPYVRADRLHTIGRMNGLGNYVRTRDAFFQMDRISAKDWESRKLKTE
jgi:flavin reductase (DIM6/NTAB) family NADH-FMN oxidoreductase RutF